MLSFCQLLNLISCFMRDQFPCSRDKDQDERRGKAVHTKAVRPRKGKHDKADLLLMWCGEWACNDKTRKDQISRKDSNIYTEEIWFVSLNVLLHFNKKGNEDRIFGKPCMICMRFSTAVRRSIQVGIASDIQKCADQKEPERANLGCWKK